MSFAVDTGFSLYELIDRTNTRNIFSERPNMLASWCKMMENAVVDFRLDARVYAGFQQIRRLERVFPRYQKMAQYSEVYVFGEPDAQFPAVENMQYVNLHPLDELTREWFLIVDDPKYARALIARETTPPGTPRNDRVFEGVLINDWGKVRVIRRELEQRIYK
jgi:DICT domain-containing protein